MKAHMLRSKLISQDEAERVAKKLDSDSRRAIAPRTPRLSPLPSDEFTFDTGRARCGVAGIGRFTVTDGVVTLHDAASDGDPRRIPTEQQQTKRIGGDGRVDYYVQLQESHDLYMHWSKVVGKLVAYHMFGQSALLLRTYIELRTHGCCRD